MKFQNHPDPFEEGFIRGLTCHVDALWPSKSEIDSDLDVQLKPHSRGQIVREAWEKVGGIMHSVMYGELDEEPPEEKQKAAPAKSELDTSTLEGEGASTLVDGRTQTRLEIYRCAHSGPLPSADEMSKYESIHPGLASRIVKMAGKEIGIRECEVKIIEQDQHYSYKTISRGFYLGTFIIALLVISGVAVVYLTGDFWLASLFLAAPVISAIFRFFKRG